MTMTTVNITTTMSMSTANITTMSINNRLKLIQSLDSLFPIGSYTLSNGMETYVQRDIVRDIATLTEHLKAYTCILSYNDLAFAAQAFNGADLKALDALCSAVRVPSELRAGSVKQAARFLKLHTELGRYPLLERYVTLIKGGECFGHYSIAMGLFIRELGMDLYEGLELYCYSLLSSMANHAVKLVPLRQLDGQKALMSAFDGIAAAIERAVNADWDDLGISGAGFDIRAMEHERLYSRLYIS